ncbi:MAG TPA: alpha/beta fold hydrolase [Pyrinomonadaceae bacterium]
MSFLNPWLACPRPNPQARSRLFCVPYAGGGCRVFQSWAAALPPEVELCAVELPGRGSRLHEPPLTDFAALIDALAEAARPYLDKPFALFGHSLGALVSFELARRLLKESGPRCEHLFASGCRAPQVRREAKPTSALPDAEFIEELRGLNGTPAEVLAHPELMGLMLPALRADFALNEKYTYAPGPPLPVPLTAYSGADDHGSVSPEKMAAWREQTSASFSQRTFPGGHFFIHTAQAALLRDISEKLQPGWGA